MLLVMTFRMENLERLTLAEMEDFVRSNRGVKIGPTDGGDYPLWSASYAFRDIGV